MLRINNISNRFASKTVLDGVSFIVNAGEVAGIVGVNGAGKTTLLRIAWGELRPDGGSVETLAGARLAYLRQGYAGREGEPVASVFASLFADAALEREVASIGARLAAAADDEREYLETEFEAAVGRLEHSASSDAHDRMADELNLRRIEADEVVGELSGGEQTKMGLIELALSRPDVLLLDEPTNNLDLRGMAWLDEFLVCFRGPVLVVSHDRALLDDHASQIIEIDGASGRAETYAGDYAAYAREKERRRDAAVDAFRRQQEHDRRIEREIRAIKSTARRHEGLSQNDFYRRKAKKIARRGVVLERRLRRDQANGERVEKPLIRPYGIKAEVATTQRSGDRMLAARDLVVSVDGRALFHVGAFEIGWGERIVIAGPNGSGKTTLLRALVSPEGAAIRRSPSTSIGYLPQASELAREDATRTPMEFVRRVGGLSETEARRFLHRFLFAGDDVLTPIERLSYGEQRRLALARLVLSGANLLVLDEPTNHLDIASREAFEAALDAYDGAILAVTHDRYFIDRLADRLLLVEDGRLREGRLD
jgi:ATPase subunit of ABC transporter with duplicated ATPase domains